MYYLSDLGAACAPRAIQRQSNYVQFKGPQKSWSCALTQLRACLNTWPKFESRAARSTSEKSPSFGIKVKCDMKCRKP